jgi:hypothetical protein
MKSSDVQIEIKYKGVGGWLLLFCLSLTLFSPLLTIYNLVSGYNEVSPYFEQFPGLVTVTIVNGMLSIGLMVFSIYAGIALWNIRPGAVKIAKKYLLVFLGCSILAIFIPFMAGLPSKANKTMIGEFVKGAIRSLFYFVIWYSYLNKSKRVKTTY